MITNKQHSLNKPSIRERLKLISIQNHPKESPDKVVRSEESKENTSKCITPKTQEALSHIDNDSIDLNSITDSHNYDGFSSMLSQGELFDNEQGSAENQYLFL